MDIRPHPHEPDFYNATFFRYPDTRLCEAAAAASVLEAVLYDDLAAEYIDHQRTNTLLLSRRMHAVDYPAPSQTQDEFDLPSLPPAVLPSKPVTLSRDSLAILGTAATRFVDRTPDRIRQMSVQGKSDQERATREVEALLADNIVAAIKAVDIKHPIIAETAKRQFPVGFSLHQQELTNDSTTEAVITLVEHSGLPGSDGTDGLSEPSAPAASAELF